MLIPMEIYGTCDFPGLGVRPFLDPPMVQTIWNHTFRNSFQAELISYTVIQVLSSSKLLAIKAIDKAFCSRH